MPKLTMQSIPSAKPARSSTGSSDVKISFKSHLWRLGRSLGAQHPEVGAGAAMPKKTVEVLNDMVQEAITNLSTTLANVVEHSKRSTVKPAHVVAALKLDMPGYDDALHLEEELERMAETL